MTAKLLLIKSENGLETRQDYDGLSSANPAFTGTLTGGSATLSEFGVLRDYVGHPAFGALYAAGVTPATTNYVLAMTDAGTETYLGASDKVVLVVGGTSKLTVDADEANLASGVALKMAEATVIDASRNITGTTVKGLNAAGIGIRPAVALADGTIDDQDAATFLGTIGAESAISDGTDLQYLDGWKAWRDFATSVRSAVLTGLSAASSTAVAATDTVLQAIGKLQAQINTKAPLAGSELLIHSDFGRVISTTGWQSTFTSNAAAGLKLAANTVTNGTQIRFEQLFQGAGSVSGAWQLALGPLLPAGTGPTYPAYLDVINTDVINSYLGRLIIEIEFLGSGSSMVAHVISRVDCDAFGGSYDQVSNGTIPFDATVDRYLDIQVQPAGMTDPVIRRNRVFRRNP